MTGKKKKEEAPDARTLAEKFHAGLEKICPIETITRHTNWIGTGSYVLDCVAGNGRGWPMGRLCTIKGKSHSGKTSIVCTAGGLAQRLGGTFVYIAGEAHVLTNYDWLVNCGVSPELLVACVPETMEQAWALTSEAVDWGIRMGTPMVIGVGSVASLCTKREMEEGSDGIAAAARAISSNLRQPMLRRMIRSQVLILVENQLKQTMANGIVRDVSYGGTALDFYDSVTLKVTKQDYKAGDGGPVIGSFSNIFCEKNNLSPHGRYGTLVISHEKSIDEAATVAHHLRERKILLSEGGWVRFMGQAFHGWAGFQEALLQPEVMKAAQQLVYESYRR